MSGVAGFYLDMNDERQQSVETGQHLLERQYVKMSFGRFPPNIVQPLKFFVLQWPTMFFLSCLYICVYVCVFQAI